MDENIVIRESDLLTVVGINAAIPEFLDGSGNAYSLKHFADKITGKRHFILIAYYNNEAVGYIVAYDQLNDGSFYCWMAGVIPDFRRQGILKALMDYLFEKSEKMGYEKIRIKTRNDRRAMLSYLVSHDFLVTGFIPDPDSDALKNQILFERCIDTENLV